MSIKNILKYSLLLFAPFILMLVVNEFSRLKIDETPHLFKGNTAINSVQKLKNKCTWTCHNDTDFCKVNHVKLSASWFPTTDKAYFGIIRTLESTKRYNLVNVVLFLLLIPIILWLLTIKILRMQSEIKHLKKQSND